MRSLKVGFQIFLVAFGLFSIAVLGANDFNRSADRDACQKKPLAVFVEYDTWHWECRLPFMTERLRK